jgi:galactokinase
VSCRELDIMSEICRSQPEILGSRMTGGGFGGCTISMCRTGADPAGLAATIGADFMNETGIEPRIFPCRPSGGASELGPAVIGLTN